MAGHYRIAAVEVIRVSNRSVLASFPHGFLAAAEESLGGKQINKEIWFYDEENRIGFRALWLAGWVP